MPDDELYKNFEPAPIQNSGRGIRPEKDPLNKFSWDTAPQFLIDMVERHNTVWDKMDAKAFIEQIARELLMTPNEQKKYGKIF